MNVIEHIKYFHSNIDDIILARDNISLAKDERKMIASSWSRFISKLVSEEVHLFSFHNVLKINQSPLHINFNIHVYFYF